MKKVLCAAAAALLLGGIAYSQDKSKGFSEIRDAAGDYVSTAELFTAKMKSVKSEKDFVALMKQYVEYLPKAQKRLIDVQKKYPEITGDEPEFEPIDAVINRMGGAEKEFGLAAENAAVRYKESPDVIAVMKKYWSIQSQEE